jgi:hypothetical protein
MENFVLNNKNRSELCQLMLTQKIQVDEITKTLRGDALVYMAALDFRIRVTYDALLAALDVREGFVIPADAETSKDIAIVPVLQTMIEIIENDVMDSNKALAFVTSAEKVSKRLQQSSDKMLRSISVSVEMITTAMSKDTSSFLSPDNLSPDPPNVPSDVMHTICPFSQRAANAANRMPKPEVPRQQQQQQRGSARRHKSRQFHVIAPKAIVAPRTFVKADARYVRRCLSIVEDTLNNKYEPIDENGKCALSNLSRLYSTCHARVTQKRDICIEARDRLSARLLELENISKQTAAWMEKRPLYTHRIVPQRALKTRDKLIKK